MLEINNKKIEVTKKLLEKECGITNFPVVFRLTNQLIKKQGKSSGKADQLNFGKSFFIHFWNIYIKTTDYSSLEVILNYSASLVSYEEQFLNIT